MRLNTALLRWGFRRLWARRSDLLETMASRNWEICPPETATIPPAICLDGAMDRVTDVSPWCDWETQTVLVKGGQVDHAASQAFLIENVDLSGAFLYCGHARAQPGLGEHQLFVQDPAPPERIDAAHMMSQWAGSHYFGSYMRDELPLGLLPPEGETCITVAMKDYEHEAGYRQMLSLPRPPRFMSARIGKLTFYSDFAQNSSKAARYRDLRNRLRTHFQETTQPPAPGVYLKRGTTGERRVIVNEAEVEQVLVRMGFDIVEPAALEAEEIARRLLDAPIIVSVEGSHLAHIMYTLADKGSLLVIQPPDRFALPYKEFTDRLSMQFAFIVGHPAKDGFRVDTDELKRVLDMLP